jgi:hypothetical protein
MDFGAISVVDDVAVGYDTIWTNEETTPARKLLTANIKSFDSHGRGLNAANQLRKQVLRLSDGDWTDKERYDAQDRSTPDSNLR